jgi:hypothetical protein
VRHQQGVFRRPLSRGFAGVSVRLDAKGLMKPWIGDDESERQPLNRDKKVSTSRTVRCTAGTRAAALTPA